MCDNGILVQFLKVGLSPSEKCCWAEEIAPYVKPLLCKHKDMLDTQNPRGESQAATVMCAYNSSSRETDGQSPGLMLDILGF